MRVPSGRFGLRLGLKCYVRGANLQALSTLPPLLSYFSRVKTSLPKEVDGDVDVSSFAGRLHMLLFGENGFWVCSPWRTLAIFSVFPSVVVAATQAQHSVIYKGYFGAVHGLFQRVGAARTFG
jgi:hypothetical protein